MKSHHVMRRIYFTGIFIMFMGLPWFFAGSGSAQEDLSVLKDWRRHVGAKDALYSEIAQRAYRFLDARDSALAGLKTRKQWKARIISTRTRLREAFGPFPERTPLNARITGSFEENGVAVELVMFESRPGFPVTAAFFKPAGSTERLPAILYLCGHSENGFRYESYQLVILNLARKGFAVLAIDPIGQGERLQYFDPEQGKSCIGGPTAEHSYAGMQYLLPGRTLAMVRVWDAMRALDYLAERPDVDMSRIGVHGRSGGGTLSAYVGALDDRVSAAAIECYITNFRRLLQSIGPQDAEQNLLSQIASGLDHGDFLIARAPKPTLVVTTTRDMFSIQGARETVESVQPAFKAPGAEDHLQMIEDDASHQSTRRNRERTYSFFMKHLEVSGSTALEEDIPRIDPAKLRVTPGGQTTLLPGGKTVYDLLREDSRAVLDSLERSRRTPAMHRGKVRKAAADLSGIRTDLRPFETVFAGRFCREGYTVEKIIIGADRTIPIPALVFVPNGDAGRLSNHPAILYLAGNGKAADAAPGGRLEMLAREGFLVLAPDLPGCGELGGDVGGDSIIRGMNYNLVFGAQLIGGSVTGIQAEAALRCLRWLLTRNDANPENLSAAATGTAGPALLHTALLEPRIRAVALINAPLSWESLLGHRYYDQNLGATIVPAALTRYDLPDLMGLLDARPILALDPVGGDGKPASPELREKASRTAALLRRESDGELVMVDSGTSGTPDEILHKWINAGKAK
jgi:dienelactone hydrolase